LTPRSYPTKFSPGCSPERAFRPRSPRPAAPCQGLLLTDVRDRAQAKLGRPFPPDWVAEYEVERDEAFRRELKPVEGAAEAVQRVKAAGLKVCVASQGQLTKTRLTLGLTGLRDLFPPYALFSAYDVPRPSCRTRVGCSARWGELPGVGGWASRVVGGDCRSRSSQGERRFARGCCGRSRRRPSRRARCG
jgi:hypothetical protein